MNQLLTPQDKAINHSPILQVYEIHKVEGNVYGSLIDWKPPTQAQRDYDYSFDIRGKNAYYILVTNDAAILRSEAISFAVALYEKKFVLHHIDLSQLGRYPKEEK